MDCCSARGALQRGVDDRGAMVKSLGIHSTNGIRHRLDLPKGTADSANPRPATLMRIAEQNKMRFLVRRDGDRQCYPPCCSCALTSFVEQLLNHICMPCWRALCLILRGPRW